MTIQEKLDDIYADLSHNVTFIYDRQDLLLAFDLAFHSVLSFFFQGKRIHKGWVEALIVSDTRCVTGNTLLFTDEGMKEIKDCNVNSKVATLSGNKKISKLHSFKEETIEIQTRRGFILEGTKDHPVFTSIGFKELKDIKINDFVAIRLNNEVFGNKKISKEKARLYGYLIGDGCLTGGSRKNLARMCIHREERDVINDFENCLNELEISFKRYVNHNCWDYWFSRKSLNLPYCNSGNKGIPIEILEGNKKANIEFLKGLFETDGHHSKQEVIEYASKSQKLANQVQLLLLNLGILSTKKEKVVNNVVYYRIFISGNYTKIFLRKIGFISKRKNKTKDVQHKTTLDTLPNLSNLIDCVWREAKKKKIEVEFFNTIRQWRYGNRKPQRKTLKRFLYSMKKISYLKEYQQLEKFLNLSVSWDTITRIIFKKATEVYDFTIPVEHNFISNGFVSHNCGKSESAEKLINHYKLGELCSAENISFAGLVGGMQQVGSRWHLTWGKIPINDRRLVIIDEVSGLDVETIGIMSGIRASGVAEIIKINTEKTHARTRLIWLSNPRSAISVNSHNSGVDIVKKLIGKPEDIARFDFALIMAQEEIDSDVINAYTRDTVEHKYHSKACHKLILWAWSRRDNQIHIGDEATKVILEATKRLCAKYSAEFPLVTVSEMKIKLARLSTALAVRLFSTDDGEVVLVTKDHVEYIASWLDKIYSKSCFSYDSWSIRSKNKDNINNSSVKLTLMGEPQLRECFLDMGQIRIADMEEVMVGGTREKAKELLSLLLNYKALIKKHGYYVKTPAFIRLLRSLESGNTETQAINTQSEGPNNESIPEMFT